jgi:hypothetical protein
MHVGSLLSTVSTQSVDVVLLRLGFRDLLCVLAVLFSCYLHVTKFR